MKKDNRKEVKFINYKAYLRAVIILGVCILLLNIMFRVSKAFATTYCNTVYHAFARGLSAIMSIFPFSFIEITCYVCGLIIFYCIVKLIVLLIKYHQKAVRHFFFYKLKRYLLNLAIILLSVWLMYSLTCLPLYHRVDFAACANIIPKDHSVDDLIGLYELLVSDANELSGKVTRDSDNVFTIEGTDYNTLSVDAMEALSDDYPVLSDYYPKAKGILASNLMSRTLTMGFYCPYTMEANYNRNMPDIDLPHTICHELSHLSGFIHEDEANFIGYLACMKSESDEFKYSGTVSVLEYVINQLYDNTTYEQFCEFYDEMDSLVILDIQKEDAYWENYRHTAISNASSSANDAYIKINGDTEGERRYDMVTDLLLEYYDGEY